jgi:Tfp pilus assembly protein PilF
MGLPSGENSQAVIGAPRSESDRQAAVQSFEDGNAYVGSHEWAKAEQSYQRAVLYDGSVAAYHAALGALMMLLHRWTDAEASYSAAMLIDVDNPEYRRRLKEARSRR